jgi:hypothetical protein
MIDISHWDFTDVFTAKEAAALIRGLDPNGSDIPETDPVLSRIRAAYHKALEWHRVHFSSSLDLDEREELDSMYLQCMAMSTTGIVYEAWMQKDLGSQLHFQKFSRAELARWLAADGKASKYSFHASTPNAESDQSTACNRVPPKGQRQEERIIELLRTKGYDPSQLPKRPRQGYGSGVKAEMKSLALREPQLFTESTFNKAWDRLRKNGCIAGGNLEPL